MSEDDEAAEHGETPGAGLLPTPERIETMTDAELRELRDLLAVDWEGPEVEAFRQRVAERLGELEPEEEGSEGGET
jgi:hypothetical protein